MGTTVAERNAQASAEANAIFNKMAQDDPIIQAMLRSFNGPSWRYYGPSWGKLKHNDRLYAHSTSKVTHNGRTGFGSWVYRVQGAKLLLTQERIHRLRKDAKARAKAMWEESKERDAWQ